jgi:DeoR/GlpR family transcriptional regulator of sugar metabolism
VGDGSSFPALEERIDAQLEEKRAIARAAVGRICDGDTVLLDGGTTTLEAARLLLGRSIQVVTNSLPIAALLAGSRETDLVLLGGYIYPKTGVALGPFTVRMMQDLHVHQTLLSVSGLTERGLFNSNLLLVETERAMMRCADEVVLLADHTKVGRPALAFLCEWSEIDLLVIDRKLEDRKKSMLAQTGARLLIAGDLEEFGR